MVRQNVACLGSGSNLWLRERNMIGNLGATTLKKRRQAADPMITYDLLPQRLRSWLAEAPLPWSSKSCKRIWDTAQPNGLSVDDTILVLSEAERKTLSQDKHYVLWIEAGDPILILKQRKLKVTSPRWAASRTGAIPSAISQIIACKKFTIQAFPAGSSWYSWS